MNKFATSLMVVALLTTQSSAVSLKEQVNESTTLWAEIEKQATHKHHKHHEKKVEDKAAVEAKAAAQKKEAEEAKHIKEEATQGLAALEKDDASLSDMLSLSKEVAGVKTQQQLDDEEVAKQQALVQKALVESEAKKQAMAQASVKSDAEIEEDEARQKAIDVTERKMLAMKYENMMIEDEKREGLDNGGSSFAIIAQQASEQDYAINTFKGSGEMSDMYAQAESESKSGNKQSEKNILAAALEKADEKSK